ncbi:MMPL family transporter [Porticoccaceae bacterium]|nr:MMPL family transporter [Porticoccaceae bacterium]MDB2383344.1 MMPL family transporter [Porticoccaceae bacterium]MDB2565979.1 MMPL family transporter [Porticoccaceae bacterium]MDB2620910.1 MMPL family transporter [Porticoccaceae bacterium]MDB2669336.1 MMPL family transporter [Porticoccaceae bacterium]
MQPSLFKLYDKIILQNPWTAIIVVSVLAIIMALGLPNFKLDASADSLTLEHDDDLNFSREVVQRYGSDNFLIVTFSPSQGGLFDQNNLDTLAALRKDLLQIEGIQSVLSMLDVPLLYSPKIDITDLTGELNTLMSEGVDKQLAKSEFLSSPIYKDVILSADGNTTGMMATLSLDETYLQLVSKRDSLRLLRDTDGLSAQQKIQLQEVSTEFLNYRTAKAEVDHKRVAQIRELIEDYRDRATIFLGGPDMITADMITFIKSDLTVFGAGILVFIIATLALIFRRIRFVVLPLITCALCLVIILGFLSWIDWRLTVISSNFVLLLLIITLALTIHLIVRYRELQSNNPESNQHELVSQTVISMAKPCLYTVLTTIVAFTSLVVSDIRPVIDFGWMMTMGISLALVIAFIIIPAGMVLLGKGSHTSLKDNSSAFTAKFAWLTEHYGTLILLTALSLAALSAYGISKLEVENRFIDYFRSDTEIYRGMETIDTALGGTTPLDIIIQAPVFDEPTINDVKEFESTDDDYAFEDEYGDMEEELAQDDASSLAESYWFSSAGLADLEKLQTFIDAQPEVGKVNSLVQLYAVARDLSNRDLNDLEIAIMRQSLSDEIYQQMVAPYLLEDIDEARIQLRAMETGGQLRRAELLEKIHQYAIDEVGIAPENIRFTGILVLYNNMLQSLYKSQIVTLGAVFVGIMIMFLVLFQSVKISIIAILPNFLAAGIVLGSMGIFGIPLDMMTITIAAITVGIGVDHAIHYLTRFKREFSLDSNYIGAMHRAHASIGQALFYTSITIIAGFSILALSNFIPSVYFGLLTGLAMLAALLGSMTLLPQLIIISKPFGADMPVQPQAGKK